MMTPRPAKRAPNGYATLRHVSRLEPIGVKDGTRTAMGHPALLRVANSPRSRDNRGGQIRLLWREESIESAAERIAPESGGGLVRAVRPL